MDNWVRNRHPEQVREEPIGHISAKGMKPEISLSSSVDERCGHNVIRAFASANPGVVDGMASISGSGPCVEVP